VAELSSVWARHQFEVVLLVAEPGSSVELCARFVHQPNATWLAPENLAVLAEAPLDLLGQAREGTLFLHEVGELTRMEQKGLLLIVGKLDKYNTRLICATARALPELVAQGGFDARLYAAIATVTVHIRACANIEEFRSANLFPLRSIEASRWRRY
jgi:transcriptional regulator with AAA-type ATPase domain